MSIFDSDNPYIVNKYRQGTTEDPYLNIVMNHKVNKNIVLLQEIPDIFTRVAVSDSSGQLTETSDFSNVITGEYFVDYNLGIVYFNEAENGNVFTFDYKGKGQTFINAERIFTKYDTQGKEVLDTLQSMIDRLNVTDLGDHSTQKEPHIYGNKVSWRWNEATQSLEYVVYS